METFLKGLVMKPIPNVVQGWKILAVLPRVDPIYFIFLMGGVAALLAPLVIAAVEVVQSWKEKR